MRFPTKKRENEHFLRAEPLAPSPARRFLVGWSKLYLPRLYVFVVGLAGTARR
jgi:hypothetical protein